MASPAEERFSEKKRLSGKVTVVTGASMGIGEAIAGLFVRHGAQVALLAREAERLEAARARIGHAAQTLAFACDVRHREEIDRAIQGILHHFGRIDIWINNAGHGLFDSISNMGMSDCREVFDTNFFATVEAMQAAIEVMRRQGAGAILNVSSVAGHIPLPFQAGYSASKFAMNAIGKAARIELQGSGIQVTTICPGYVRTDFGANARRGSAYRELRPPAARGITARRVARATLGGYLKGKREVIVPWTMHPVVKIYQLFPGLVEWSMKRMAKNAGKS